MASSNQKLLDKQMIAVDEIWKHIIQLRNFTSPTVLLYSAYLPEEYMAVSNVLKIEPLAGENIGKLTHVEYELHRPYIGEYIWSLYSLYRSFQFRLQYRFDEGKLSNEIKPWYSDKLLMKMVNNFLGEEEAGKLDFTELGTLNEVVGRMEHQIIIEFDKLISGSNFSQKNIQEARKLLDLVNSGNIQKN